MGCGRCFVVRWYMLLGYIWDVRGVSYGRSVVYVVRLYMCVWVVSVVVFFALCVLCNDLHTVKLTVLYIYIYMQWPH